MGREKISCLFYADDLVSLANSKSDLQHKLNILHDYCKEWCLEVNRQKAKVIIFNDNGRLLQETFCLGNNIRECVKHVEYLELYNH